MTIGERIKEQRKLKKLTQAELAEKCNIHVVTLRQYEGGRRQPHVNQLAQISNVLNVPLSCFIDVSDDSIKNVIAETVDNSDVQQAALETMNEVLPAMFDLPPFIIEKLQSPDNSFDDSVVAGYGNALLIAHFTDVSPKDLEELLLLIHRMKGGGNHA
ncbi:MAG: helix-turn-helix domain-containing protein [Defluviitaleaceae bacterium]|nr:helix-turn-helix domain-containing protein [Defluviitaleaceae bacterium]